MTRCPVSVVIPTLARGSMVLKTVEKIKQCEPPPSEIIIHVDQSAPRWIRRPRAVFAAAANSRTLAPSTKRLNGVVLMAHSERLFVVHSPHISPTWAMLNLTTNRSGGVPTTSTIVVAAKIV